MIKIELSQKEKLKQIFIQYFKDRFSLATNHDVDYYEDKLRADNIKDKTKKYITENENYLIKRKACDWITDNVTINGYSFDSFVEDIATGDLDTLRKFQIDNTEKIINADFDIIDAFKKLLNYKNFQDKYGVEISRAMGIKVCPYCNMSYTVTTKNKKLCHFDHFYDKDIHPWFSVSLNNLIPSCSSCNSNLKGTTSFWDKPHLYPYKDSLDNQEVYFKISTDNDIDNILKSISICDFSNVDYKISHSKVEETAKYKEDKAKPDYPSFHNSLITFDILNRYNQVKSVTDDLLKKIQFYNKANINAIYTTLGEDAPIYSDIKRIIFTDVIDEEKHVNYILGKLQKDIYKQFNLD